MVRKFDGVDSFRQMCSMIEIFVLNSCKGHRDFYIGVTTDPDRRLKEHRVNKETDEGYVFRAESEETARQVERQFTVNAAQYQRMQGNPGGAGIGNGTYYVYCYLITPHTIQ